MRQTSDLGARPGTTTESGRNVAGVTGELGRVLQTAGVIAALGYLNARARFRYTGIFRPEPPLLRNIRLFDRENPTIDGSGIVIALIDGYCGIACSTNAPFATSDSLSDPRLGSHPAREAMRSYAGVPIRIAGTVWGTLCHYDMRPRLIPATELPVLEQAMPLFADWVREHCAAS